MCSAVSVLSTCSYIVDFVLTYFIITANPGRCLLSKLLRFMVNIKRSIMSSTKICKYQGMTILTGVCYHHRASCCHAGKCV